MFKQLVINTVNIRSQVCHSQHQNNNRNLLHIRYKLKPIFIISVALKWTKKGLALGAAVVEKHTYRPTINSWLVG